jgi:hypothetical protein
MILSLTKDPAGKLGLCEVPSENVIFLHYSKKLRMTVIHTVDDLFYGHGPLEFWCDGLRKTGEAFAIVDRGIMAQVSLIKHIDNDMYARYAYFDDEIKDTSKRCTLSKPNADVLFGKLNIGNKARSLI